MSAHCSRLILIFFLSLCGETVASEPIEKDVSLPDAEKTAVVTHAAEVIQGYLRAVPETVYAKRTGPCTLETLQKFHGELATHQQVTINFQLVDLVSSGKTLGPNRNDTIYRKIAEKRPYAIFYRSQSGQAVTRTKTWFEPNLFKLPESFSSENEDAFFVQTEAEMAQLKTAVSVFAAQCTMLPFMNQP